MTPDPWTCLRWARAQECGSSAQKFVLVTLASYAGYDHETEEWSCHPGQATLADGMQMGERTVRRHLKALEVRGLIERSPRFRPDGTRSSDHYRLPANLAAGQERQPAKSDTTTGQIVQGQPATGGQAEVLGEVLDEVPESDAAGADGPPPHVSMLCDHLADAVEGHSGKRPRVTRGWITEMDRLCRLGCPEWAQPEPVSPKKIDRMIRFVFSHNAPDNSGFCWADQIRSAPTLRKQWEKLRVWANRQIATESGTETDDSWMIRNDVDE